MNIIRMSAEKYALPSLAWVAKVRQLEPNAVSLWCGDKVEVGSDFAVEGVWPGSFLDANFIESELFYGSGFKFTGEKWIFSCSCSTVDRLWCHQLDDAVTISNSLPSLLAIAGVELIWGYAKYAALVETIVRGREYQKDYPINKGKLTLHYFENINVNKTGITISTKKGDTPSFDCFQTYSDFLFDTATRIGENAKDGNRKFPVEVFSTVSRGYDSPVATIMAMAAGSKFAYTFSGARSLIPRDDSGAEICYTLGISCKELDNGKDRIKEEIWYWAANGSLQDMNFSILPYPSGVSVMFTGFNGDMVWSKSAFKGDNFLKRKDSTGLGFCEHRLMKGVIHCPVPFWGISRLDEIKKITFDNKMKPWSISGDYDRPIPRRILESAGVPRSYFGQKKSATTIDELTLLPMDKGLRATYKRYLNKYNGPVAGFFLISTFRQAIDLWRGVFRERVLNLVSKSGMDPRYSRTYKCERFLFPWANSMLKPTQISPTNTKDESKAEGFEKAAPAHVRH